MDVTLMMLPGRPAATNRCDTRWVQSSTWRRFDRYSASQPFSVVSSSGEENTPPALLTRMLTVPSSSAVRSSAASTCPLSRTSVTMPSAPMPSARRRAGFGVAFPDGDLRAERGQPFGDAAPDALSPPVTTATRPVSRMFDGSMAMGRVNQSWWCGCHASPERCR